MPSPEDINEEIPSPSKGITPSTRHYSGLGPILETSLRQITTEARRPEGVRGAKDTPSNTVPMLIARSVQVSLL
jgi:hypothetical protein